MSLLDTLQPSEKIIFQNWAHGFSDIKTVAAAMSPGLEMICTALEIGLLKNIEFNYMKHGPQDMKQVVMGLEALHRELLARLNDKEGE